jgi:GcrA cell cycle regulator
MRGISVRFRADYTWGSRYVSMATGRRSAFLLEYLMARQPVTSPWTPEQDERLRQLAAQGATALRAAAALKRPLTSVRIRARKLGLSLPGVREVRRKLAASLNAGA